MDDGTTGFDVSVVCTQISVTQPRSTLRLLLSPINVSRAMVAFQRTGRGAPKWGSKWANCQTDPFSRIECAKAGRRCYRVFVTIAQPRRLITSGACSSELTRMGCLSKSLKQGRGAIPKFCEVTCDGARPRSTANVVKFRVKAACSGMRHKLRGE